MCLGIKSPGTLNQVLRGYLGDKKANNIFEKNYEEIDYMKDRITQKKDRYLFHQDNSFRSKGRTTMKISLLNQYLP